MSVAIVFGVILLSGLAGGVGGALIGNEFILRSEDEKDELVSSPRVCGQ